ncbi:MAG: MoxR family ATPase [Pseudomonadota bacterium]
MSLNARTLSAGEALRTLTAGWQAQKVQNLTISWMLHGRPGVGKTEIVRQLADTMQATLFDIRLTTIEPQDLRGLPYYDHKTQRTIWYRPEDLPDDPDRPALLFLDELTAASPYLQPTVYGLLQERRVGRHVLPQSVFIVAAGNTIDDGAVAYEMGTALSDRLVHLHVEANAKDWLEHYAVDRALHPAVTAFLRGRPDLLDTVEDSLRRTEMIACTPRSWERVSQIMKSIPDKPLRQTMVAGTIGVAAAAEFARVADEIDALVSVDELIEAQGSARPALYPVATNGIVGLIYALVARSEEANLPAVIEVMAGIRDIEAPALPLADLTSFGFELLVRKALNNGWQEVFRGSKAYADFAAERDQVAKT